MSAEERPEEFIPRGEWSVSRALIQGRQGNEMILNMVPKTAETIFPTSLNTPRITAKMPAIIPKMTFPIRRMMFPIKPVVSEVHRGYTKDGGNHEYEDDHQECSQ